MKMKLGVLLAGLAYLGSVGLVSADSAKQKLEEKRALVAASVYMPQPPIFTPQPPLVPTPPPYIDLPVGGGDGDSVDSDSGPGGASSMGRPKVCRFPHYIRWIPGKKPGHGKWKCI